MRVETIKFAAKSILFESNDPEVKVTGWVHKGVMSFQAEMLITQSQLNNIINQLQRENSDHEILTLLETNPMFNGETLYSLDLSNLNNTLVELEAIHPYQNIRQIRA